MKPHPLITFLIALAIPACTATPDPASPPLEGSSSPAVQPSAEPVATQQEPAIGPVPPATESQFQAAEDRGLVTVQHRALMQANESSTIRVAHDGAWTRRGATPTSGKLDAKQLASLRKLVDEVAVAKPSTGDGAPCDALPIHASRILFAKDREIGWSGPCSGPPPPPSVSILAGYLNQLADGAPASELEKILARPR